MKIIAAALLTLVLCFALLAQEKTKKVSIKGTVVAENVGLELAHACYHVCGLSLIVKLDKPTVSKFVIVNVEYMDDHSRSDYGMPGELVEKAARWKFEAVSEPDGPAPLQKYMRLIDEKGKDMSEDSGVPNWRLLKGAEREILPYGEPIPSFRVRPGKFKSIE